MKKIGIMGGTFNPIHKGHVQIAKAAYEQYDLDEVWFMPNHIPAYKPEDDIVSGKKRLDMVKLAISSLPYCKASDFELKRTGKTYSCETFEELAKLSPEDSFYFIMGADSLFYFDRWKNADQIVKHATILAAPRDENGTKEIRERIKELERLYGKKRFRLVKCSAIDCSSSEIRKEISRISREKNKAAIREKQRKIKEYLPDPVYGYIKKNELYRNVVD